MTRLAKLAAACAIVAAAMTVAAPAQAGHPGPVPPPPEDPGFNWWGFGGCHVPVLIVPTDPENVEPWVPAEHRSKLLRAGYGPNGQVGLVFILIDCPQARIERRNLSVERGRTREVVIALGYQSGILEDVDKPQLYALAAMTDWGLWTAAEQGLGLPTSNVSIGSDFTRDPVSGFGTFSASVPWNPGAFSITGTIAAPNFLREFQQDAVHYHDGAAGFVRVTHDEAWAPGNEVVATITAPDPDGLVARWMGGTTRHAQGVFVWIHDSQHVHRYEVLEG